MTRPELSGPQRRPMFASIADIQSQRQRNDAKCQSLPYAPQQSALLFDHLVGAGEELRRNFDAQRVRSL